MLIKNTAIIETRTPERKPCTLMKEIVVELGKRADYSELAGYHYRQVGVPPMIKAVYRAVYKGTQIVGVLVYGHPALQLKARNIALKGRYRYSTKRTAEFITRKVNQEVEVMFRIIVHPTFRGIGLAQALLATKTLRPVRVIEASGAMVAINPFPERAGFNTMRTYANKDTERILGALRAVGISDEEIVNPPALLRRVKEMPTQARKFIEKEMLDYLCGWVKARAKRKMWNITLESAASRIAGNALLTPVYVWWENPDWKPSE